MLAARPLRIPWVTWLRRNAVPRRCALCLRLREWKWKAPSAGESDRARSTRQALKRRESALTDAIVERCGVSLGWGCLCVALAALALAQALALAD